MFQGHKSSISSWKIGKGAQIAVLGSSGAKLLEGYDGVKGLEQPCYNDCCLNFSRSTV